MTDKTKAPLHDLDAWNAWADEQIEGLEEGLRRVREYKEFFASRICDPNIPVDEVAIDPDGEYEDVIDMRHFLGMVERVEGSYRKLLEVRRQNEAAAARKNATPSDLVTPLHDKDVPKHVQQYYACKARHWDVFKTVCARGLAKSPNTTGGQWPKLKSVFNEKECQRVLNDVVSFTRCWDVNAPSQCSSYDKGAWVDTPKSIKLKERFMGVVNAARKAGDVTPIGGSVSYWRQSNDGSAPVKMIYYARISDAEDGKEQRVLHGQQYRVVDKYKNMLLVTKGNQYWVVHEDLMTAVSL